MDNTHCTYDCDDTWQHLKSPFYVAYLKYMLFLIVTFTVDTLFLITHTRQLFIKKIKHIRNQLLTARVPIEKFRKLTLTTNSTTNATCNMELRNSIKINNQIPQIPIGLPQVYANTCFYNAAIQAFSTAYLSLISERKYSHLISNNYPVFKTLFKMLTDSKDPAENSKNLLDILKSNEKFSSFNFGTMDDSFLFLRCLVLSLQVEYTEFLNEFTISREIEGTVTCCDIEFRQKAFSPMYYVQNEYKTIEDQLTDLIVKAKCCPVCKSEIKCNINLPSVLLVATPKESLKLKVNTNMILQNCRYELVGFSGSYGYHAIAFSKRNSNWFHCNDSHVHFHQQTNSQFFETELLPLGFVYLLFDSPAIPQPSKKRKRKGEKFYTSECKPSRKKQSITEWQARLKKP